MKKTRFSEVQIVKVLKQQEADSKVGDLCREPGISVQRFVIGKPSIEDGNQ